MRENLLISSDTILFWRVRSHHSFSKCLDHGTAALRTLSLGIKERTKKEAVTVYLKFYRMFRLDVAACPEFAVTSNTNVVSWNCLTY